MHKSIKMMENIHPELQNIFPAYELQLDDTNQEQDCYRLALKNSASKLNGCQPFFEFPGDLKETSEDN